MKNKNKNNKNNSKRTETLDQNFFNEMNYELAGEIGAIDPEEMNNNQKLITGNKRKVGIIPKDRRR